MRASRMIMMLSIVSALLLPVKPVETAQEFKTVPPMSPKQLQEVPPMSPKQRPVAKALPRPVVIIGGWSNCPAHFTNTTLVRELRRQRGEGRVLLTTHRDPWGDIDANAVFEAAQIVSFMDQLKRGNQITGDDFDLIGFSMGGLVVRSMVLKHPQALGPYRVFNLVTMATPNHGANPILTNIDPGIALGDPKNPCDPGRGPIRFHDTAASREMAPTSDFLRDLNSRTIPANIRATTIAGQMFVETRIITNTLCDASCSALRPVGLAASVPSGTGFASTTDALCSTNCSELGPFGLRAWVPSGTGFGDAGGSLQYTDQWQGQCRIVQKVQTPLGQADGPLNGKCVADTGCLLGRKDSVGGVWKCRAGATLAYIDQWQGQCRIQGGPLNGQCSAVTVCPPGQEKFADGGVWKCRTPGQQIGVGSGGFIRIASIHLTQREASNLVNQHVFDNLYHTQGTLDQLRQPPNPKPLVDARGVGPNDPGHPILGTAVNATWYFQGPRVINALLALWRP